jgi:hypothetical protein
MRLRGVPRRTLGGRRAATVVTTHRFVTAWRKSLILIVAPGRKPRALVIASG